MADAFALTGSYTTTPSTGVTSGYPAIGTPIDEQMMLAHKQFVEIDLTSDSPQAVSFGGVASAALIVVKTTGGKVDLTLTSADGTAQVIPVDSFAVVMSASVPYSALLLTRAAATPVNVKVFLGERA